MADSLSCWFIDSLFHWFLGSLIHGFVAELHWFRFIESSTQYFTHSLIHYFIASLIHWFLGSLIDWLIHWLTDWLIIVWLIDSLLRSFIDSSTDLVHEFNSFSQLWTDSFMSCHSQLNHHLLLRWCTSQLQQFVASASQKLIDHHLLKVILIFRNFRPSAGRALPGITIFWWESITLP